MFARENPIIASPALKFAAQWLSQSLVVTQTSSRGSPESRTACGTIGKIPQVFEDFNGDFRNRFYIHKAYVSGQNFRPETYALSISGNIPKYGQTYGTNVPPFWDPIPISENHDLDLWAEAIQSLWHGVNSAVQLP